MDKNNLSQPLIRFLTEHQAMGIDFDATNDVSLHSLETIRDGDLTNDNTVIEKILNTPKERQDALINQLNKVGFDFNLVTEPLLTNAQFDEHIRIAHYNYEVEYGHLKDSGKAPVDLKLISDPSLTDKQLQYILSATTERLLPEELFKDGNALPESEMYNTIIQQRENKSEYSTNLAEVGVNQRRLNLEDNNALFTIFTNGKDNPQEFMRFHSIIADKDFQNPELRSALIQKENQLPEKTINFKNIVKSFFSLDSSLPEMDTFGSVAKPSVAQHLIDEVNQMQFEQAGTEKQPYQEDPLQQLKIHKDNVEITSMSPNSLERAIMVAAVKFGVPLIVEGSQEFKDAIANTIATNEKLSGIPLHGELQEIVDSKILDKQQSQAKASDIDSHSPQQVEIDTKPSYEVYATLDECLENSNKEFVLKYEIENQDVFVAFDNQNEIQQYLKNDHPIDVEYSQDIENLYHSGSTEDYAIAVSEIHGLDNPSVHELRELENERDNGGMEL